jgi:LuxR family transcriptional regulator, maltose regulon positive regulatory protein
MTDTQKLNPDKRDTSSPSAVSDYPRLWARFFGEFELVCDGEPVPLGPKGKTLTILKYLLAHKPPSVFQDHLMCWLWPEVSPKQARWSLNSSVRLLREVLKNCTGLARCDVLVLEDGRYRLSRCIEVLTDVDEFDERQEQGRCLEREGRTEATIVQYERAVGLYRGGYLLEDLYEDWTMIERERLSNAYVEMLYRLAIQYLKSEQPWESTKACRAILKEDACHEAGHRLLMECFVSLGLRSQALNQYHLCCHMLKSIHDMEPSLELRALYDEIKKGNDFG